MGNGRKIAIRQSSTCVQRCGCGEPLVKLVEHRVIVNTLDCSLSPQDDALVLRGRCPKCKQTFIVPDLNIVLHELQK